MILINSSVTWKFKKYILSYHATVLIIKLNKSYYVDTAALIDTNLGQPWLTDSANTRGTAAPQG